MDFAGKKFGKFAGKEGGLPPACTGSGVAVLPPSRAVRLCLTESAIELFLREAEPRAGNVTRSCR